MLACAVVAAAATFLSQHYGAPVMLFALLLGMAMNFLSAEGPVRAGHRVHPRARAALSAWRCSACASPSAQVVALGWHPFVLVVLSVALTIGVVDGRGAR